MDIRQFLTYLHVSHGPNGSGNWMCRCPAHDDRTASLSVGEGRDGRILLKCMAGCSAESIVKAVGLTMRDLGPDDGGRHPPAKPKPKPAKPPAQKASLGKLTAVYPYTDEDGKVLFEVCRFESEENGERVKTFRQRHRDPGNPRAKADGYVWSISGVRSVVYRLPEVKRAIAQGRTVYLVEGEKDADTMTRMGYTATTNPGGASKSGKPKWLKEHTEQLAGARVVILPDNDDAGINDRRQVAAQLAGACESVKLLDLTKACPSLPRKGDITDMLGIMGETAGMKALRELEDATAPMEVTEAKANAERDAAAAIINNLPGYCVDKGCICTWAEDNPKRLCTFTAITSGIVMRDDGLNEEKCFLVDGWTASGDPLPRVRVPAAKFRRMDWLTENWDIRANIMPGTTATDKVRYVISEAGAASAKRVREYTHTGWRKIRGKWCYLYRGGAIGAEDVTVDLSGYRNALDNYCLDQRYDGKDGDYDFLLISSLLRDVIPRNICTPLLSLIFLAPLRDALMRGDIPPAFTTYLCGGTQNGKSTISALMLSFFGHFTYMTLPESFGSTANAIRKKAFALKDMVLAIDDYHPTGSLQAKKRMEDTAQQLSRAFGDLADRERMNADGTLSGSMPPRCMALITGEDVPNIGESGTARYYVIDVRKVDIPIESEEMMTMQEMAADGKLAHGMRKYIEWLAPQMDGLPETLSARFKELRSMVVKQKIGNRRASTTIAHLLLGYEMYLRFMIETGIMDDADGEFFLSEMRMAASDIAANSAIQAEESRSERPSRMFLNIIGELLLTRQANVMDLTDASATVASKGNIGYMDAMYYYLVPGAAYAAVCEICTKSGGGTFPLTQRMLQKQLLEDGMIVGDSEGKRTRVKIINGKGVRLLWIPREHIDGPSPSSEQMRMDMNGADGFKETDEKTLFNE